jgi:hypothetical protein
VIGYSVPQEELEALLEEESPGWLQKATARTEAFREKGRYEEKSSIWSVVKPAFMRLQGECKCAYCERKLEHVSYGRIEQDVEHFRPKGKVRAWRVPSRLKALGVNVSDVPNGAPGYYLLSYHPFNYAAACKPCNSALKKNYFPILGEYDFDGQDPRDLLDEKPLLIYPLGDFDESPECLIRFYGVSPQAVAEGGYRRFRALVTIEFFKLDDVVKRKNLIRERATIIVALYPQLEKLAGSTSASEKAKARELVKGFTSPKSPHTNCALSFKRLYESAPAEAEAIYDRAVALIVSIS